MKTFPGNPIYLAAKFVCMYWSHPIVTPQTVVLNSMSANTLSSLASAGLTFSSPNTGRISSNSPSTTDDKTSNPQP